MEEATVDDTGNVQVVEKDGYDMVKHLGFLYWDIRPRVALA